MKKSTAAKKTAKKLVTLSLIGINLFSPQLLNVYAQDSLTKASLTMDDTANIINGLNETHMWSNDGGTRWRQAREGQTFTGEQTIQVARFDKEVMETEVWQVSGYHGGTRVLYNGAIWENKWYAEPTDVPGISDIWVKVKDIPAPIAVFNFTKFTDAEAEKYLKAEAERVQNEKKVIGYFSNWHGYKNDYQPQNPDYGLHGNGITNGKGYDPEDVPYDKLTHVNYAFMIIDGEGNLISKDPWADFSPSENGDREYIKQVIELAEENDVTAMVSIGGWTNSVDDKGFDHATATPERMNRFTTQLVEFMTKYGFDGIDLDWEYPENEEQKEKFVTLVKQLREKMTVVAKENEEYYQLTAAVTANHEKMEFIAPEITNDYFDAFNVMTYDFRGGFDNETGHQSPLYPTATDKDQKFNISSAMEEYHNVYGIPKNKLMVGMSYYSRGFANVNEAGIGVSSNGAPVGGTWDDPAQAAGLKPWWQLKDFEAQAKDETVKHLSYHWDDEAKAPYIYDSQKKELYTYDNIETISRKVNYTIDNGYGGAIIWELAHDTPETDELTSLVDNILTGERIDLEEEEKDTEAPTAPKNLKASDITEKSAKLTWEASTDNKAVTGYQIFRDGKQITTVNGSTLTFTDNELQEKTTYKYTAKAIDAAGNVSASSNEISVTTKASGDKEAPTAPKDITGRIREGNIITIQWNYAQDNVGVAGYIVYRDGKEVGRTGPKQLAHVDKDLAVGKEYTYTVKAYDAAGNISPASTAVKLKTEARLENEAPTTPTNFKASNITESSVSLSWSPSTDNASSFHYRIYRDGKLIVTLNERFTSYTDGKLTDNTKYVYTIEAIDNVNNVSKRSSNLTVTTKAAPDTQAPTAPKNLKASDITDTTAKLTWDASSDNKGVTGYRIFRDGKQVGSVNGTTTTFTDRTLKEKTIYKYTVKAIDAAGNLSGDSNAVTITTKADTQAPTAPKNLTGTSTAVGEVRLNWAHATDNKGIASYQIFQGNQQVAVTPGSVSSYTLKGLKKGEKLTFKVRAIDAAGNLSPYSNTVTVEVKALVLSQVYRASLATNELLDTTKTLELDYGFRDKFNRNELNLLLFDANKKRLNLNDFDVIVSNTSILGNTYTPTSDKSQGHINLPIRGRGTVTISLKHKKEGYTHKLLTVKVSDIVPFDTVTWASKPTADQSFKPGGDIAFSSWYKDKFGRREINLILKKNGQTLDMRKYDVISSNRLVVLSSNTPDAYKAKGHMNLPMVNPGTAKITIREKTTGRIFEVATLYHSFL